MKKLLAILFICISVSAAPKKPKLVLTIVIDQFRYDYLTRFRADYTGGLARLLTQGAVFTNANYEHFPNVTAVGHSTILSGATPSISGIVANDWVDRATGEEHSSVIDKNTKLLGGNGPGASPNRLLVSTVGDELKMSNGSRSKVIGISFKDRSAILPVGHMADGAYWWDLETGNFVSSTYYFSALPKWAADFNAADRVGKFLGKAWMPYNAKAGDKPIRTVPVEHTKKSFEALEKTPFGNDLLEQFVEAAIDAEKLGQHDSTDLLEVSFSSNDILGHEVGPDATEVRDMSIQTDRVIGKLLRFIDVRAGAGNTLVVLTADHGVSPTGAEMKSRKMPGGQVRAADIGSAIESALAAQYKGVSGKWIQGRVNRLTYLNRSMMKQAGASEEDVQHVAAAAVKVLPHVFRVYTAADLKAGRFQGDRVDIRVRNGYNIDQGADLYIVLDPYYIFSATGTDHGQPFNYDSHVPLVFMGRGIKAGEYDQPVMINDIAPTLSTLLAIETPGGSVGRVLNEMFAAEAHQ
jgi:hypothetical protein